MYAIVRAPFYTLGALFIGGAWLIATSTSLSVGTLSVLLSNTTRSLNWLAWQARVFVQTPAGMFFAVGLAVAILMVVVRKV